VTSILFVQIDSAAFRASKARAKHLTSSHHTPAVCVNFFEIRQTH
jgi:hypothetical protein